LRAGKRPRSAPPAHPSIPWEAGLGSLNGSCHIRADGCEGFVNVRFGSGQDRRAHHATSYSFCTTYDSRSVDSDVSKLLLVPLDDIVVFPQMNVTLTVDVGDEERVLLVPKHEGEYAAIGTVARVTDRVRLPGGATAVALEGLHRGLAGAAETDTRGRLFVEVEERRDSERTDDRIRELETEYRAVVEEILDLRGDDGRIQAFVRSIAEPGALADTSGYAPDLSFAQKVQL